MAGRNRRKSDKDEKVVWLFEQPYGHTDENWFKSNARPNDDGHGPERRRDPATLDAIHDLFNMVDERQISGLAAVALRPDGSHYLVVSGKALEQNIHASGAVTRLLKLLNSLDEELIARI